MRHAHVWSAENLTKIYCASTSSYIMQQLTREIVKRKNIRFIHSYNRSCFGTKIVYILYLRFNFHPFSISWIKSRLCEKKCFYIKLITQNSSILFSQQQENLRKVSVADRNKFCFHCLSDFILFDITFVSRI